MNTANRICAVSSILICACVLILSCVENTSVTIESDARLQLLDFLEKQNKLYERQKQYLFQDIIEIQRLDRKNVEVTFQYVFSNNYMTVDRTDELKQHTFLFQWQDPGKLIAPSEGEARRVNWALTKTWEYQPADK